jgi:single-stranded-DNA-specific exonuclease
MNRIWRIKDPRHPLSQSLTRTLGISRVTAQLLVNRGIEDEMQAHHFLYADIASLHDARLLKDMGKAASRIKRAIKERKKILLYGDYDVDGISGVALLYRALTCLGSRVTHYIPKRSEGYGLNVNAVKSAHTKKVSLIITVDCGISAKKEVGLARRLGIDVIVTDHHEIKKDDLPDAYAVINPHQDSCRYPFKHLSGVGLAYKLADVLLEGTGFRVEEHLDLVALGTVSDLSAQKGENRVLTKCGLKELGNTKKIGIRALIEASGLKGKNISASHIGFVLGPRINAMGRVGSPEVALELLLTNEKGEAKRLADILNKENRQRQKIERDVLEEAMEKVKREINFKESRVIVLSSPNWHAGVIGIVANRIVDKYYRPTIMIATGGKTGKGSGRSIHNFHLFNAIDSCKQYLSDFGGHDGACGLVIDKKNIEGFTGAINAHAKTALADHDLYPTLDIDAEVALSELSEKLVEEIALLAPFGPENPRPVLSSSNVYVRMEPRRIAKNGVKMLVTDEKVTWEAVSFRAENMSLPAKGSKVSLVYTPSINTWQGLSSLQLDLRDLKVAF